MRLVPVVFLLGLGACAGRERAAGPPAAPVVALIAPVAPVVPVVAAPVAIEPVARTVDVVDRQFGLEVPDPYRWMETERDELATWMRAHGERTAAWLAGRPGRDALRARIEQLGMSMQSVGGLQLAGGRTFYMEVGRGMEVGRLMVRDAAGDRVLVDPATLGGDRHAAIDSYRPSSDGTLVAYNLSRAGSEVTTVHVVEVATGKLRPDAIERVWGEFPVAWLPDGRGFFYTQLAPPRAGVDPMLNMQVRLHRLGQPVAKDVAILGAGVGSIPLRPEELPDVWVPRGSTWAVATIGGAHSALRVAVVPLGKLDRSGAGRTPWTMVAEYADGVESVEVHGGRLYALTYGGAPNRKVVSMPLAKPALAAAKVEIPERPETTLVGIAAARDALFVRQMLGGGEGRVLRLPWKGPLRETFLHYNGWIPALVTDPLRDGAVMMQVGWTKPPAYSSYRADNYFSEIGLGSFAFDADYAGVIAQEVEVASHDGVDVPLSILSRDDLDLDGSHPTLLVGYGAYGTSLNPSYSPTRLAWLERGGVIAFCHVRGGGEKGHQWQVDGSRARKLDGVRDFIACGEHLIEQGYTTRARLVAEGASAGGILIGRAITLRPDLFAAVDIGVGMVNPLRTLAAENGANQKTELGDPETEAGYRWIHAMDPYVHVAAGTAYPAVLFTVGLNDRRVAPWMSAKMAARLLASSTSGRPILVRTDAEAGHGIGSTRSQAFAERADIYAFYLAITGAPELAPR